jgi:hypothetical protein
MINKQYRSIIFIKANIRCGHVSAPVTRRGEVNSAIYWNRTTLTNKNNRSWLSFDQRDGADLFADAGCTPSDLTHFSVLEWRPAISGAGFFARA